MNVLTVVSTRFWPKPAVTTAMACDRIGMGRSVRSAGVLGDSDITAPGGWCGSGTA